VAVEDKRSLAVERLRVGTSTTKVWFLVAFPATIVLTCGILILAFQQGAFDVIMGVVLLVITAALGAGASLTIVDLRRDRRLAALQLDFVSKVSHELKTPLTSIRMFTDTLKLGRAREPEKVEQCVEVISKETERLTELIGRLLSWGAMEQGEFKVKPIRASPQALVDKAISSVSSRAQAADIELTTELADDVPDVMADGVHLVDALVNLLSNALNYGQGKPVHVKVERRGENRVAIDVIDHGIGIEPRHQSRIFDRFYRADERYARATGGTGLGLAIARHIVLAHDGTIEINSRPGDGSTFTVVLPAATDGEGGDGE